MSLRICAWVWAVAALLMAVTTGCGKFTISNQGDKGLEVTMGPLGRQKVSAPPPVPATTQMLPLQQENLCPELQRLAEAAREVKGKDSLGQHTFWTRLQINGTKGDSAEQLMPMQHVQGRIFGNLGWLNSLFDVYETPDHQIVAARCREHGDGFWVHADQGVLYMFHVASTADSDSFISSLLGKPGWQIPRAVYAGSLALPASASRGQFLWSDRVIFSVLGADHNKWFWHGSRVNNPTPTDPFSAGVTVPGSAIELAEHAKQPTIAIIDQQKLATFEAGASLIN
jgi:hypothetical protein